MFIGMASKTQVKTHIRKCHLKTRFGRLKENRLSIKIFSSSSRTPLSPSRFLYSAPILILLNQNQALFLHGLFHLCPEHREKIIMKLFDLLVVARFAPSCSGVA